MGQFKVIYGNRLELLAEEAGRILGETPAGSPFEPEYLVVQTPGMERWLSLEMARMHGIFGGFRFLSPDGLGRLLAELTGRDHAGASPFDRHNFTWAVARLLEGAFVKDESADSLCRYIEGSELKRFQIASRIADLFDQYAVYRPDLLDTWEKGDFLYGGRDGEDWQAALWRNLCKTFGGRYVNRHDAMKSLLAEIRDTLPGTVPGFPRRITAFGVSVLPPLYLDLFHGCSLHCDVFLFAMNPTCQYWADLTPERVSARARRRMGISVPEEAHFEVGNRLLAGLGRAGRDFFSLLFAGEGEVEEAFGDPGSASLLQKIQGDILHLTDRGSEEVPKDILDPNDTSLKIASCHSPLREVEALQDWLLSRFDGDETLAPRDVLVLTPDINAYAPYIEAVFGTAPDNRAMPFSLADRTIRNESRIADVFLAILELVDSRLELSAVLAILDAEPVRRRFGLSLDDLEMIRRETAGAGIRWGRDGAFRASLKLFDSDENTWRHGLDRLIMGYAAGERGDEMFDGILPFGAPEGEKAAMLGKFFDFCEGIFSLLDSCSRSMTLAEWHRLFLDVLGGFFEENSDTEQELRYILGQVNRLPEMQQLTGYDGTVSFSVMKSYFTERFNTDMTGRGFITGGVTFCSMVPLRSIPFRVICLLGMNDEAFPRRFRSPGFDLIARHGRRGDRNIRESDRYLFLETILSCRESLYVSYVGRSISDNSLKIPSSVVTELISYISNGYCLAGHENDEDALEKHLVTEHPLQSFSPRYFSGAEEKLFSYSSEACRIASSISQRAGGEVKALSGMQVKLPLSKEEMPGEVTGRDLVSFLENPSRHFLRGRLGIAIESLAEEEGDEELFSIQGLEKYFLQQDLLERYLNGEDASTAEDAFRARGLLPHGTPGTVAYASLARDMDAFAQKVEGATEKKAPEKWEARIDCNGISVTGHGSGLYGGRMVMYRPAKLKGKDYLRLWVNFLLCSAAGFADEAVFIAGDGMLRMKQVTDPVKILDSLLHLYREGFEGPLPFFPESSLAWMETMRKDDDREKALKTARKTFLDNYMFTGEKNRDPWFQACFGESDLSSESVDFARCAGEVYGPLLSAAGEGSHE